jgi:PAS domain S-box-containing protein
MTESARANETGEAKVRAWTAIGPLVVLACWLMLAFAPSSLRLPALYATALALSVIAFAMTFRLAARDDALRLPVARSGADRDAIGKDGDAERSDTAAAGDADTRFRLLIEAAPNAMIMVDAAGTIQLVNSQAERLFGYARSQLLGKSVELLLPAQLRAMHRGVRAGYLHAPQARRMGAGRDLFGLRADGSEVPLEIGLSPVHTESGTFVLASIIDITERKRAELALRASEERFRLVVEDAPNAIIMVDEAGSIALVNGEAERLFGYAREELIGRPVETLVPQRLRGAHPQLRTEYIAAPRVRSMGAGRDLYGLRRDGSEVPIEIGLNPIRTAEGAFVLASVVDITERKRAQAQFAAALREKTVLLNEVHHRVKNNLQVITSLLNLQAARARDPAVQSLIAESRARVQAMTLIHQLLFERHDWSSVHLAAYLHRLGDLLASTYGGSRIAIEVEADEVDLDVQRAVPCGLLVNELVTNAFKHAFPGERRGRIRIELRRIEDDGAILRVSDDGIGLPPDLDIAHASSLGMQLVPLLAEQLGATLQIERGPGARFELRFPITTTTAAST